MFLKVVTSVHLHNTSTTKPPNSIVTITWIVSNNMLGVCCLDDLVAFFNRCKTGLKLGGMIFVKENVTKNKSAADDVDHSVTR